MKAVSLRRSRRGICPGGDKAHKIELQSLHPDLYFFNRYASVDSGDQTRLKRDAVALLPIDEILSLYHDGQTSLRRYSHLSRNSAILSSGIESLHLDPQLSFLRVTVTLSGGMSRQFLLPLPQSGEFLDAVL